MARGQRRARPAAGGKTMLVVVLGACAGIGSTVTMDALGSATRRIGLTAGAKGQWIGRWYMGMTKGQFVYSNIAVVPEQVGEKRAALAGHYVIGVALAVLYVVGAGWVGVSPGSFVVAVSYGLATCVFPWFLVFPALGFGVFGRKGPRELKLFASSLINHLFYGLGLWWTVKVLDIG
jgi:hypothetical protein